MTGDIGNQKKAAELLELSRDELFQKLTEDREPGFIGDLVREGRRIFERTLDNQREKICKDDRVQEALKNSGVNRRVMIVCAIADALGTAGGMTIAALLVEEGMEVYCRGYLDGNET